VPKGCHRVVNISLDLRVKEPLVRTITAAKNKKSRRGRTPGGIPPRRLTHY